MGGHLWAVSVSLMGGHYRRSLKGGRLKIFKFSQNTIITQDK